MSRSPSTRHNANRSVETHRVFPISSTYNTRIFISALVSSSELLLQAPCAIHTYSHQISLRPPEPHTVTYILCLPSIFPGKSVVVITHPRLTPPARYNTLLIPLPPPAYNLCAISGLTIPNKRPQKLAIPHAVPLIGAGNASGVHPYSTALNIDWKKYSMTLKPIFDAALLTLLNRKMEMPIIALEMTMVHLRPTDGTR
jgi:hypothetical protein